MDSWGGNGRRQKIARGYEIRTCRLFGEERGVGPGDCGPIEAKAYVAPSRDCVTSHDLETQVDPRVEVVVAPKFCLSRPTIFKLCTLPIRGGKLRCDVKIKTIK